MQSMELPLVVFTVLSQAAIGLALMGVVRSMAGAPDRSSGSREWRLTAGLMLVGLVASLFHLGHPTGAPTALRHLDTAWLSREVLAAGIFTAIAVVALLSAGKANGKAFVWGGAIVGLVLIFSAGMTYAPPALPAVHNALPTFFFLASAIMLGAGFASWFAPEGQAALLSRIFTATVVATLVLNLVVPCVWLSGGTVMQMTGHAWFGSGFYWAHVAVLVLSLGVLWKTKTIPMWLPVLVLFGELLGRAGFFADTVHTAMNMGGVY